MLGWGSVIQIMTPGDSALFFQKAKELLLRPISDANFACFPYYIPLLERKTLLSADRRQVELWFCGSGIYVRESPEDGGILIASRESLNPILRGLGARLENDKEPYWEVTV
jgi:hypothetical protein